MVSPKKKFKTTNPKYRNSIVHTFYTEKMQSKVIKVLLPQEEQNEPKLKKHKIKKSNTPKTQTLQSASVSSFSIN